ncbi:MAG: hypothetical protein J5806_03025 [Lentisphaeria bacterium]|nr:hypothetical protein [Lentisphaeria bacterium]
MNKTTAIILCVATFIAGEVVGFLFGRAIGRSNPPVQSQQNAVFADLQAEAQRAQETSRRAAAEADAYHALVQRHNSDLDRLAELNYRPNLYDSEKSESREIIDRLAALVPDIRKDYSRDTGKIQNLGAWAEKVWAADRAAELQLRKKAEEYARIAVEKQMEVLKHSVERMERSAR